MFWKVFQVTGTAGLLAYCFATFPGDLWFQKKRRAMVMDWIDGVVFALLTAAVFAWLWPGRVAPRRLSPRAMGHARGKTSIVALQPRQSTCSANNEVRSLGVTAHQ